MRLAVIIINYRTAHLVHNCLTSLVSQLEAGLDCVVVVDNASGDGSAQQIEDAVAANGWQNVVRVVRAQRNGGFSYGNNVGIHCVRAESYLLLNSDTIVKPGAIAALLAALRDNPTVAAIGPRLEWPNGEPQASCFHLRTPRTEFLRAAATGLLTRLAGGSEVAIAPGEGDVDPAWVSFACVLLRGDALRAIGDLDEGYFMYFEDIDYCRRLKEQGWGLLYRPDARVIHLRGGTSSVKSDAAARRPLPRYYYESRARYFAKFYGAGGLWLANVAWTAGWVVSQIRRIFGRPDHHLCRREGIDNWTNALRPLTSVAAMEANRRAAA